MKRFGEAEAARTGAWAVIVAASSIVFSLALACATPFAAISAVTGSRMTTRAALALTFFAWLANQLVGYLVLGYPRTWESFGWGAAIGVAALFATAAVLVVPNRLSSPIAAMLGGFCAAFAVYELVLFAATAFLPSGSNAFSITVIAQIFWTNVLALIGLVILHRLATAVHLLPKDMNGKAVGYA